MKLHVDDACFFQTQRDVCQNVTWPHITDTVIIFGNNSRSKAANDNSFYHITTKRQEVKIFLKAYRRTMSHAYEVVFQLSALKFKQHKFFIFNPLTPNEHHSGRTAPLNCKRCILYIYSTNTGTEYFKH